MRVLVLEMLGLLSLVAAGWLVSPALGLAVFGVACLVTALSLARSVAKDDDK